MGGGSIARMAEGVLGILALSAPSVPGPGANVYGYLSGFRFASNLKFLEEKA